MSTEHPNTALARETASGAREDILNQSHIVLLLGPPGSGKTNFVHRLTAARQSKSDAADLRVQTTKIQETQITLQNHPVVLIDTPPLCLGSEEGISYLTSLLIWLAEMHFLGIKPHAVLYFSSIFDMVRDNDEKRYQSLLRSLVGSGHGSKLSLVTTGWDRCRTTGTEDCERRENQLKEGAWKVLVVSGCGIKRFENDYTSAMKIIQSALGLTPFDDSDNSDPGSLPLPRRGDGITLQVSKELFDAKKPMTLQGLPCFGILKDSLDANPKSSFVQADWLKKTNAAIRTVATSGTISESWVLVDPRGVPPPEESDRGDVNDPLPRAESLKSRQNWGVLWRVIAVLLAVRRRRAEAGLRTTED